VKRLIDDYVVREVKVTSPVYDASDNTIVTGYQGTPQPIYEGGSTTIYAVAKGSSQSAPFEYIVDYEPGQAKGPSADFKNVRTDKVYNQRDGGIVINFGKWNGTNTDRTVELPLAEGEFTLLHYHGGVTEEVGKFTSDSRGLVTIMYDFESGNDNDYYIIREDSAPAGYVGLQEPVKFYVNEAHTGVTLIGNDPDTGWANCNLRDSDRLIADINIYNPGLALETVKYAGDTKAPLQDAHFSLYRQLKSSDGQMIKDYTPVQGMSDIITGQDGVITGVDGMLDPGVYYLTETSAPTGYESLAADIVFEITSAGQVRIISAPEGVTLSEASFEDGVYSYRMKVTDPASESIIIPTGIAMSESLPVICFMALLSVLSLTGYIFSRRRTGEG